jgi:hypothetical protein
VTIINLISNNGDSNPADMAFSTLVNVPINGIIEIRTGVGFQLPKKYKRVSDYTFEQV